MADIQTAINNLQDDLRTIPGIRQAPYAPPDNMQIYPFCTAYAKTFVATLGAPAGQSRTIYEIVVTLHVARKGDLPREYTDTIGHPAAVIAKLLANPRLGGEGDIVTDEGPAAIDGEWSEWRWGEEGAPITIGWEIRFPFKITSS